MKNFLDVDGDAGSAGDGGGAGLPLRCRREVIALEQACFKTLNGERQADHVMCLPVSDGRGPVQVARPGHIGLLVRGLVRSFSEP